MKSVRAFAPGRTELAGNHTDHQGGRVIAAAVDCGIEVSVRRREDGHAVVASEGFAPFEIDLADLSAREGERLTTASLVRGVVAGLSSLGVSVAGFDAKVSSTVPSGGGLSSSAAFELALAQALFELAGAKPAGPRDSLLQDFARVGQAAERDYFGKPCGLMDQLAVALGGVVEIDFADPAAPQVERIGFDFERSGYALYLIDTHCDHSLYTAEYAQVACDMNDVARYLGAAVLSEVPEDAFFDRFNDVRTHLGDAPALRGLHYYHECRLVDARAAALRAGDIGTFLALTRQSGASSAAYLQNVSTFDRRSQPAMVALSLADAHLKGEGACRIHGGGFGGTVQAFVPLASADAFARAMDGHLGPGSARRYKVGTPGTSLVQ